MNYSISPINNKKYSIPKKLSDKDNIDDFIKKNNNKKIVVVQGLGFVGAVMSLVCANSDEDYAVIGVDVADKKNYWKIKNINEGVFPVIADDPNIELFYNNSIKKNNFYATFDPYAYSLANVIIVDINLDVQKKKTQNGDLIDFNVNLNPFKNAISTIGMNCKEDVLILVETTVPPGTCLKVVKPTIEKELIKRGLSSLKFSLGHSYERVMPGPEYIDSIKNFYRVYSGINKISADKTEIFLKTIISTKKYPLTRLENTNATELSKVLENSYRAMNIAFITEWSRFAEDSEVNLYEVIDAIRMRPTHSNIMYPGIGVGGYCLTKDPLLASWSKTELFNSNTALKQSINGVQTNDKMPKFAFDFMKKVFGFKSLKKIKILLLGVSYRSNVGDTRYSPVESFYNYCINDSAIISVHDPYVTYWEEIGINVDKDLYDILSDNFHLIVISTGHDQYKTSEFINFLKNKNSLKILDTVGLLDEKHIKLISKKHMIKVLGRGDI